MIFEYFTLVRRRRDYEIRFDPRLPMDAGPDFPQDIVEEIISRLHPKERCSFKTVSKGFKQLISSKSFLMNNLNKLEALDRAVYIFQEDFAFSPLYYHVSGLQNANNGRLPKPEGDDRDVEIVTSSEGLVLFCDRLDDLYLFDPISHQTRVLPTYGRTEVMVYSKNSGDSQRAPDFPSQNPITQAGVHVCGRVHWKSSNTNNVYSIIAFDLKSETYSSIKVPNVPLSYAIQQLVSLDSKTLALSCSLIKERAIHTLWILRDYCDDTSWYRVDIDIVTIGNHFGLMTVRPLSFIHMGGRAILIRVDPSGVFGIYDIEDNTFNQVGNEELGYVRLHGCISFHPVVALTLSERVEC